LDPGAIFAKTAKGREEISQRSHGLPQRLRTLLVMIDGQTTAGDHREKCKGLGDVAGMLAALSTQGFIADVREQAAAAPAPRMAAQAVERSSESTGCSPCSARTATCSPSGWKRRAPDRR
jgi:hypothetical protein